MKHIVILSDTHFGSVGGLLPPDFVNADGVPVALNVGQKYLWKCWLDFCSRVKEFAPVAVIINGDVVEGTQAKEGGLGLSLRLMADQKAAAIVGLQILKSNLPEGCQILLTQGTKYHTGECGEAEEDIAGMIGAKQYFSVGTGRLVREVLWLNVDGVIIEAMHGIGGTSGFYRATAMDREMQWSAMAGKDASKGMPKADLIVRSHVHFFVNLEHASKQAFICPCWQLQMRYARRASLHRMIPDIGGVFVEVDAEAKKRGEPPCRILKQLYDLPPVPVTKL